MAVKKCFHYVCKKYPECELAGGMCCDIECWTPDAQVIPEGSCTEENGYPEFVQKKRVRYKPPV